MAAEVDLPSSGWSFQDYSSQDQSQEELVQDHGSISFGRYDTESLSWEKKSVFTHDRRQEELDKLTFPGLVAQKKAYFEQYYKKVKALKGLNHEEEIIINQPPEIQISNENQTSNEIDVQILNEIEDSSEIQISNVNQPSEIQNSSDIEDSFEIQILNEIEDSNETQTCNKNQPSEIQSSNEIQTSFEVQTSDEIQTSNGTNNGEVKEPKEISETENNNIIIIKEDVPVAVPLARRKTIEKFEHEKKLARAFDNLSKDWVKLKNGMTPIRRNARAESENGHKFVELKCTTSTRSFGTVKEVISNNSQNKNPKPQLKPKKEQKYSPRSTNSVHKTLKIGTTGTRSRPGTASSRTKPVGVKKDAIGTSGKENIRRPEVKNVERIKSTRSSWENLMRPTAASSARTNILEDKRKSVGVSKKPVTVPQKPRSFNKSRPNNTYDKASRTIERNKPNNRKIISSGIKRTVPKKTIDSSARLKKKTETVSINKRTRLSANSLLNNKKQRQERPAWR